jgi:hypothetical protein
MKEKYREICMYNKKMQKKIEEKQRKEHRKGKAKKRN